MTVVAVLMLGSVVVRMLTEFEGSNREQNPI